LHGTPESDFGAKTGRLTDAYIFTTYTDHGAAGGKKSCRWESYIFREKGKLCYGCHDISRVEPFGKSLTSD
jgi:hypothetical protein